MTVELARVDPVADRTGLVEFLSGNHFPFHAVERPTESDATSRIDRGVFSGPANVGYWISAGDVRIGIAVFEGLDDGAPLIDLRLADAWRAQGFGTRALTLATGQVFGEHPEINRIEGNTRVDNVAMRRVFGACGYVKEAHYREAWPVPGHEPVATVAYAILRRDWSTGSVTPVPWDD